MSRNVRHGPRFSGGNIEVAQGPHLASYVKAKDPLGWMRRQPLTPEQIRKTTIGNREAYLKKKGIKIPLATFSFDAKPAPQPRKDVKALAQRALPTALPLDVIMEQNGCALVSMLWNGKEFIAAIDIESGKLLWTEGEAPKPPKRLHGPHKRKMERQP